MMDVMDASHEGFAWEKLAPWALVLMLYSPSREMEDEALRPLNQSHSVL